MQAVSAKYNPYADIRRVNLHVVFSLSDTKAVDAGTPAVSGQRPPTQLDQVMTYGEMSVGINTLEPAMWLLNGRGQVLPEAYSTLHTGWWSNVKSDENGVYQVQPTLTFTFSEDISCAGFTLNFDTKAGEFPAEYTIHTYDSENSLVSSGTFQNESAESVEELPSEGIRKVVFTFTKSWLPGHYVRVSSVVFGLVQRFNKDSLISADSLMEASLSMDTLPSGEFAFTFDNMDNKYNLLNPNSLYRFLQAQQTIDAQWEINGETVNGGKYLFYTSESDYDGMTATIRAVDYAIFLEGTPYSGGSSGTWTFNDAVSEIKSQSGLDFKVNIPTDIAARTVSKAIPENTNCREALRLFAQAAMCSVYFDRDGVLAAADPVLGIASDEINADNAESVSGVSIDEPVNTVELKVNDSYAQEENTYTAQDLEPGEAVRTKTVNNPCAVNGQEVAQWLLSIYTRRIKYSLPVRGNPALDPIDTVNIQSIFGMAEKANITKISTSYSGGLTQDIQATGGTFGGQA